MKTQQINILLADDDQDDRIFFDKALKELPIMTNLTMVTDGGELMDLLEDEKTASSGRNIPRHQYAAKTGSECLHEIKRNERLKDLPVVMFSTSNSPDDIRSLFQTGANVYIHKPNDFTKLKEVIHHALPISIEKEFSKTPVKYILNA